MLKIILTKRKREKVRKKSELWESIVKERLEDTELINKANNNSAFQDQLDCVKQYKKHLQKEKTKIIKISYKQGPVLYQLKESENLLTF